MATTARAGASRAGASILSTVTPKRPLPGKETLRKREEASNAKKLAAKMHRSLYPHLYTEDGTPAVPLNGEPGRKIRTIKTREGEAKPWDNQAEFFRRKLMEFHNTSKILRPPPIRKGCPNPVAAVNASQITTLDPTGARTRLFDRGNPECARVGDVLLVRLRTGDPFAGVCINIRRRGTDTAILLRGQLTRVGVEMWYKVYSPLVEGIEVVQRAAKRARRARLTYMRKPKHDRGSVENLVRVHLRQKAALGATTANGKKDSAAKAKAMAMAGGKKKKTGRGKKR
ncbi:hypothetical protein DM02DRAFT_614015 [Periconia macrospinosa]|uniref:Mitochondrial ribosomal protein-like protein n=1 Tax=Periconia macrospinosa TaxID=97972 RepID=A0A2V1DVU8_9PLEO|nr:hypothetical protein DM02DRAFT_614015 [Periconia macrospinosa]